jgi:pyruvate, water dikinase
VVYRATDFRTNEFRGLTGGEAYEPVEHNPMIWYRGCYRYVKEADLFALELEALASARAKG